MSFHSARMWLTGSDSDVLERMNEDLATAARHLGSAAVDLVVYACTGGSLINGPGHDLRLAERISTQANGIPAITTTTAVMAALERLALRKLTVLTPYMPTMTNILKRFLQASGYEVVAIAGRNHASNLEIGADAVESIIEFSLNSDRPDSEGFFMSCTNWRAMAAAEAIERMTGKKVVTANQATLWHACRTMGVTDPIDGYGQLLRLN